MEFIISSEKLITALNKVKPAVSNNPVVPIVENVICKVKDKEIQFISTDLQRSIITSVECESKFNFEFLLPFKTVYEFIKNSSFAAR